MITPSKEHKTHQFATAKRHNSQKLINTQRMDLESTNTDIKNLKNEKLRTPKNNRSFSNSNNYLFSSPSDFGSAKINPFNYEDYTEEDEEEEVEKNSKKIPISESKNSINFEDPETQFLLTQYIGSGPTGMPSNFINNLNQFQRIKTPGFVLKNDSELDATSPEISNFFENKNVVNEEDIAIDNDLVSQIQDMQENLTARVTKLLKNRSQEELKEIKDMLTSTPNSMSMIDVSNFQELLGSLEYTNSHISLNRKLVESDENENFGKENDLSYIVPLIQKLGFAKRLQPAVHTKPVNQIYVSEFEVEEQITQKMAFNRKSENQNLGKKSHFSILNKLNFKTPNRVKSSQRTRSDSFSGSDNLSTAYQTPIGNFKNQKIERKKSPNYSDLRGSLAKLQNSNDFMNVDKHLFSTTTINSSCKSSVQVPWNNSKMIDSFVNTIRQKSSKQKFYELKKAGGNEMMSFTRLQFILKECFLFTFFLKKLSKNGKDRMKVSALVSYPM